MLAIRIAVANPGTKHRRDQHMEAHKHHLRTAPFKIVLSGPMSDPSGIQYGAVVLAEVDNLVQLKDFSDNDPFVINGVYQEVSLYQWSATIDNR